MPAACERNAHAADLAGICEATSTRPQAFPREKGWVNGKDRQICHCEPVTDVTGAAIRFPFAMPCITPCLWGRGFPRRCAHRLGMTWRVRVGNRCVSVVRCNGSMWVGRERNARPTDLAGICEAASTPTTKCVPLPRNTAILCFVLLPCGGVRSPRPTLYRGVLSTYRVLLFWRLHRADRVVRPYNERCVLFNTNKHRCPIGQRCYVNLLRGFRQRVA